MHPSGSEVRDGGGEIERCGTSWEDFDGQIDLTPGGTEENEQLLLTEASEKHVTDKPRFTLHLGLAVLVCTLGSSFPFGFSIGVINAPQQVIQEFLNQTVMTRTGEGMSDDQMSLLWSVIVSIWAVGGLVGAPAAGFIANTFGRRGGLLLSSVLVLAGGLLMGFSKMAASYEMLIAGRFLVGIQCGLGVGIGPMYLSEVSPVQFRGRIGTLNQVVIICGMLTSEIVGLNRNLGNAQQWHYLFGLVMIPPLLHTILFSFCPESPRHLYLNKHRKVKALQVLQWLQNGTVAVEAMKEIEREEIALSKIKKFSVLDLLRSPPLRAALVVSVAMHLSQQLSGVNAAMFYSTSIFLRSGVSLENSQYATVVLVLVHLLVTLGSSLLVDRTGRRPLHLTGLAIMVLSASVITIAQATQTQFGFMVYVTVGAIFCYLIGFGIGPGSIPWFVVSELFAQGPRGAAVSIAVFTSWTGSFVVGISFPALQRSLGYYCFLPFIGVTMLLGIFIYFRLPETKRRCIEDITAEFQRRTASAVNIPI